MGNGKTNQPSLMEMFTTGTTTIVKKQMECLSILIEVCS